MPVIINPFAFGAVVSLPATILVSNVRSGGTCVAGFRLESDGDYSKSNNDGTIYTDSGDWVTPTSAAGAAYECRATIISGSLSSGTTGTWQALSSNRTWIRQTPVITISTCVFTLEIRDAASGTVLATSEVTLEAERDS